MHGVRPISLAISRGWAVRTLLYDAERALSAWARRTLDETPSSKVAMSAELIAELGERDDTAPELVAVVALPADDLARVPLSDALTVVLLDRPSSPGNIGTVIRSADALGAAAVIVTGHAADVYDPKAVRASTGSLFAVPAVRVDAPPAVLDWVASVRAGGVDLALIGTDESGPIDLDEADLTGPTMLLIGNETAGLSAAWRQAADLLVRIPIGGAASSLNAASAASIALYESTRQRRARLSA